MRTGIRCLLPTQLVLAKLINYMSDQDWGSKLLKTEKVSFEPEAASPTVTDEALNLRYVKGDVRIVTESARYSLAGILAMMNEMLADGKHRYKLDPEYQRRHRWNKARKSRLIESFLMNVPVPPVFLYETDLARFEVMDGRQRLTALSEFYSDKLVLEGLEYWGDLDGRTYSTLPDKVRDGIDRRYISSIILLKETASDELEAARLKKLVFERLNSGGVELSGQETRNAVYNGPLNQLCLRLSENAKYRQMWGIPEPSDVSSEESDNDEMQEGTRIGRKMFERMDDVELVLRFFAYRQLPSFKGGLNKISDFLDKFLMEGNKRFSPALLTELENMFLSTIDFLWEVFETKAFCVQGQSVRPTKTIFDPIMYVSNEDEILSQRPLLIQHKERVLAEARAMYSRDQELFSGRKTNFADTKARNSCVREMFRKVIREVS